MRMFQTTGHKNCNDGDSAAKETNIANSFPTKALIINPKNLVQPLSSNRDDDDAHGGGHSSKTRGNRKTVQQHKQRRSFLVLAGGFFVTIVLRSVAAALTTTCTLHGLLMTATLLMTNVYALPAGFIDEEVSSFQGLGFPTDFDYIASEDILIVTTKSGGIYVIENPSSSSSTSTKKQVGDLSGQVCDNRERGMQSVTVHPSFGPTENRFIYLYYTAGSSCLDTVGRLSRFVMTNNDHQLDMASELILMQTSAQGGNHNGGAVQFGRNDGYLYIATGDAAVSTNGQNLQTLLGKVLRLTDTGGIPNDNPFVATPSSSRCHITGQPITTNQQDANAICQEIYAYGLRNPFKTAMDRYSTTATTSNDDDDDDDVERFWIMDVGGQTWEEINECGTEYAGANYGWNEREGPCSTTGNQGNNINDCNVDANYQDPKYFYLHDNLANNNDQTGASITGGDFVPSQALWPSEYDGTFIFADFVFGALYHLVPENDPSYACRTCNPPIPAFRNTTFHEFAKPLTVSFVPYQDRMALYYSTVGWLRRIVYQGGDNISPVAIFVMDKPFVQVGETIQLNASQSYDVDVGDILSYSWDFGDGSDTVVVTGEPLISYTYAAIGTYRASLTVLDNNGGQNTVFQDITVGTPPLLTISSPVEGTRFAVGDYFTLTGSAVDSITGQQLPPSFLSWEVRQHHDDHYHPFLSATGKNNVTMGPAPWPEDFAASTNSYLEVILRVTDGNGLTGELSRNLMPKTVFLDFDTVPSGLSIELYDFVLITPTQVLAWENQVMVLTALEHKDDEDGYEFVSWSDGGAQTHEIVFPPNTNTTTTTENPFFFVATYAAIPEDAPLTPSESPSMAPTATPMTIDGTKPLDPTTAGPTSGNNTTESQVPRTRRSSGCGIPAIYLFDRFCFLCLGLVVFTVSMVL